MRPSDGESAAFIFSLGAQQHHALNKGNSHEYPSKKKNIEAYRNHSLGSEAMDPNIGVPVVMTGQTS